MLDLAGSLLKANEPEWKLLHRLADELRPELQRELFNALDSLKKQIPTASLVDLIEQGQLDKVLAAAKLELPDLEKLRNVIGEVTRRSAERANTVLQINERIAAVFPDAPQLRFDMINRRSTELLGDIDRWKDHYGDQLIKRVNDETQMAVNKIVQRGFLEGIPPRQQALMIAQVPGLAEREAGAVNTYFKGLVDSGIPEGRADDLAAVYRNRLLKKRAQLIARTETMRASNMGQQLAWDAAADAGLLIEDETFKVWIVTDDDRTCSRCLSLEDATVAMDGSFREGGDTAPSKGATTTLTPPLHPGCRCAMGLEFTEPDLQPAPAERRRSDTEFAQFQDASREFASQLANTDEAAAINDYAGFNYRPLNAALRRNSLTPDQTQTVRLINRGLDQYDGYTPPQVWRNVTKSGAAQLDDALASDGILTHRSFMSTSADPNLVWGFGTESDPGIIMEIRPKSGAPIMNISGLDAEAEWLIGTDRRFRVIEKTTGTARVRDRGVLTDEVRTLPVYRMEEL